MEPDTTSVRDPDNSTSRDQRLTPGPKGRAAERRRLDDYAQNLDRGARSIALVGEAGIGKSTLWRYAVARCRAQGALVLECRATEEDRALPRQGLLDLLAGCRHDDREDHAFLEEDLAIADRARGLLAHLRDLAGATPVVLAIDDLPWLDDVTLRALRFSLRRLEGLPVTLLATARGWDAQEPDAAGILPALDADIDVIPIGQMPLADLTRVLTDRVGDLPPDDARRAAQLAHGNPMFALELARRQGSEDAPVCSLIAALDQRLAGLPEAATGLARVLAVGGPTSLTVLRSLPGIGDPEAAVRIGLELDVFSLDSAFVVRFAHPLLATAVLRRVNALERRALHATLAMVATDDDTRALHHARALLGPDAEVAAAVEAAAERLSRGGAPRLAAELLADAVRLTPPDHVETRVRRVLAQMMQHATAGDLRSARDLADQLLAELPPGPLRAEVIGGRVEMDLADAEAFLRGTLAEIPDSGPSFDEPLRGRLLGLLGWLLALHLGRITEGLTVARESLAIARRCGDRRLLAQAAATVATASLMLGEREDDLMAEAVDVDRDVLDRHLVMWPRVLLGRQLHWDGQLASARGHHEAMDRRAASSGAELQRSFRLHDLAQVEIAAGDLDLAERYVENGLALTSCSGDQLAATWLAQPAGYLAALRGDAETVAECAGRLDAWAARVGERPRSAMAAHLRGVLAASRRDWSSALDHLLAAQSVLDEIGVAHPGVVPVLPLAIQVAHLAEQPEHVRSLAERLERQGAALASPWVDAHRIAARAFLQWHDGQDDAVDSFESAHRSMVVGGYRLDAARLACAMAGAGLRWGRRRQVRSTITEAAALLARHRVRGWEQLAADLRERVCGEGAVVGLTATEAQVVDLVGSGQRNREIAATLFVSESTVEAHLTRVYRKLGVRNRAELTRHLQLAG